MAGQQNFLITQRDIPDLQLEVEKKEKSDLQNNCDKPSEGAEVVEIMENSVSKQEKCMVTPSSDYWEHSENSLVDEAG